MQPPMPERRVGFGLDLLGHQAVLSFWFGVPPQRNPIPYIKSYIYIYYYIMSLGWSLHWVRFGSAQGGTLDIAVHRSFECFLGHSHAF